MASSTTADAATSVQPADGVQDVLEDNLGISPTTAIIMLMAFSVWNGLMFIIVMFYILKSTNWLQRMDFTLHGQKHKIHKRSSLAAYKTTLYENETTEYHEYG